MKKDSKKITSRTPASKVGRVFHSDKLLEQEIEYLSEGTGQDGKEYEFYLGKISRSPIIKSRNTERYFILPWPEIIKLGIKAGLNKP